MKKSLLIPLALAAVLAACSSRPSAPAQTAVVPNPEKQLYVLKDRLHLTEEQMTAIRPILEEAYPKQVELMQRIGRVDEHSSWEDRQEAENLEWAILKKLSVVLTEEQMDEYCKFLDEKAESPDKPEGREPPDGKGPGGSKRPGGSRPSGTWADDRA